MQSSSVLIMYQATIISSGTVALSANPIQWHRGGEGATATAVELKLLLGVNCLPLIPSLLSFCSFRLLSFPLHFFPFLPSLL